MSNDAYESIKIGNAVTYYGCRNCILEGFVESFEGESYVIVDKVSKLRYQMKRSEIFPA